MVRFPALPSALVALATWAGAASGLVRRQWPEMPTFTASAALYPLELSEIEGVAWPYFSGIWLSYDAASSTVEFRVRYKTFAYVSPAYEWLESRSVCVGHNCTTMNRNGTACYEGIISNLGALATLLFVEMPSKGSYVGPGSVEGQACDLWHIRDVSVGNLTVCMGADGVPRSMLAEPSVQFVGRSNVFSYSQNMTLQDLVVGAQTNVSIEPIDCPASKLEACTGGGVASYQVLRFSDGEPWGELQDRDTCDWAGVGVTGGAPGFWSFMGKRFLEVFDVDLDTGYGPWRDCNWDPVQRKEKCLPELPPDLSRRVSRSSAEMLTGKTNAPGQCEDNALVGSWLVFPHQGRCGVDQAVGDGGCTWKVTGFKVVEIKGWLDAAPLQKAWETDWQKAPFPDVQKYLKGAVAAGPNVTSSNLV